MIIPDSRKTFRWVAAAVLVLAVLAAGIFWMLWGKKQNIFSGPVNYTIPGVPYIGIHNHTGKFNGLFADKDSAIVSVLEYWKPGENDLKKIRQAVARKERTVPEMANFVNGMSGMKAELKALKLDELRGFVSFQGKTPLMAFFALDENQPAEMRYYPARVLIGIKESEKRLIFHDYWLGNNYEITFDAYNKLLEKTPPALRNKYLVIQPVDLKNKLKEIKKRQISTYPARTEIMDKAEQMFKNYALAWDPHDSGQYDLAINYFSKVLGNPKFEEFFPPEYKVRAYSELAEMQLGKNDLENALKNVQKAVEMNHDLDKPFGDWPGYELGGNAPGRLGEITVPFRVAGDIYMRMNNFEKAKENYAQALVIKPTNSKAKAGLAAAEAALK